MGDAPSVVATTEWFATRQTCRGGRVPAPAWESDRREREVLVRHLDLEPLIVEAQRQAAREADPAFYQRLARSTGIAQSDDLPGRDSG
jgi:hypothetical protein